MNQTSRWPLLRGRPMLADKLYTNLRAADVRRLMEYVVELTGIAVIYVGLAKLSLALASIHPSATPIWPPTGYALAVVLLLGYRISPAIFLGALVANVTTAGSVGTHSIPLLAWPDSPLSVSYQVPSSVPPWGWAA